ncbi:fungal-specific transcription factor domain-containing protein [Roridomyces roridus]|uniref:Fungal-specific transcription factor domain-containing protein n=1 Tax=Roridomyces roridus TaxID=1738132 RepID=A0AAD7B8G6_9AGAR|nr:fungal-specific transcription factor domain-containing protein [Roridomyces roridus]
MTPSEHVATLLSQGASYLPDGDLRRVLLEVARYARTLENQAKLHNVDESAFSRSPAAGTKKDESKLDMFAIMEGPLMTGRFARLKLSQNPTDPVPYFGKTSQLALINAAMKAREGFNSISKVPRPATAGQDFRGSVCPGRPEDAHSASTETHVPLRFLEPDLLQHLVSLYFTRVNILIFLLHQPTFEKSLADGLHLVDYNFGCTVLVVCALASRCSGDPRVVLNKEVTAGWEYFSQLKPFVKSPRLLTLYEAQTICLSILYDNGMLGSSRDGSWAPVGSALRYVQEIGVHRRNRFSDKYVSEAWKRVFWELICLDTLASAFTTRPMAMSTSDYDVDYPVECDDDDEWWESSDPALPQRDPAKPSFASFTVAGLKLMEILAMAQKTLYLVRDSEKPQGWPQSAVAAVDSALNAWIDEVPEHLRWNQDIENPAFAAQSAILHARYYGIQIHTHRIFIPSSANKMEFSSLLQDYPALAICASSARACTHVMNAFVGRGVLYYPLALNAVFDSALVLLLHVWSARQGHLSVDRLKCLQDVDMCLRVFRFYETKWRNAGFYLETITELMSYANMDQWTTQGEPENPLKRAAHSISGEPSTPNYPLTQDDADSESVQVGMRVDSGPPSEPETYAHEESNVFSLPMRTDDLGRLPVYEPFNWKASSSSLAMALGDYSLPTNPPPNHAHGL